MWYPAGFSGSCCMVMVARGSVRIVVEGVEGDGAAVFPAVKC